MLFGKDIIRKKLSPAIFLAVFFFSLFLLYPVNSAHAQVPSSVCLGACPTGEATPTSMGTQPTNTTTIVEAPSPTTIEEPCDPTIAAARHHRGGKHHRGNGGMMQLLFQMLLELLNKLFERLGLDPIDVPTNPTDPEPTTDPGQPVPTTDPGQPVPTTDPGQPVPTTDPGQPVPTTDPCPPTTVAPTAGGPTTTLPTDTGFPYPRGTAPAYGYMACNIDTCKTKGATLIHPGWRTDFPVDRFVADVNQAKSLGVQKYLVSSMAPDGNSDAYWASLKAAGITDEDFFGVYFPDEPENTAAIATMYQSMKKYFPKALAGDYGVEHAGMEFAPYLDIAYFTTYTKFHDRAHAFPYSNLISSGPAWKAAGKYLWETTETFGAACVVTAGDPELSTEQLVIDRQISQIVMGILGGAQGVFPYAEPYSTGTPCDTAWTNFKPRYVEVWPWIMKGDRTLLTTQVTSGTASIDSEGASIPAVVAYLFTDASGKKLVASASMLDVTEANNTANAATITGVPNGTYDVMWENRTVTVTDGTIKDTWKPYAYHFYKLK